MGLILLVGLIVLIVVLYNTEIKVDDSYKKGHYRNIPIYGKELDDWGEGLDIKGRNEFYSLLVDIVLWFDTYILMVEGYEVWIEEDKD